MDICWFLFLHLYWGKPYFIFDTLVAHLQYLNPNLINLILLFYCILIVHDEFLILFRKTYFLMVFRL